MTNSLRSQIITTVGGNGIGGYSGDGGPALSAKISDLYYIYPAFDNAGNMYFAAGNANTIRKIDNAGIISTICGTPGVIGYSGDGGSAVNALLYHPAAIAVDDANNIFIADQSSTVIRKIDAAGIITTVSGQFVNSCVVGDGGPFNQARFKAISALTTDHSGNLFISDYGCNVVRKVNSAGIVSTVAGNGSYGFSGDGGPATSAQMAYPCKVAVDNVGNIYIPDAQNHRVRKVSTAGVITTIAGIGTRGNSGDGGPATLAQFAFPGAVVVDRSGNLYVGDYNNIIKKIDPSGIVTSYAGTGTYGYTGDGGPAILADIVLSEGRISIDNNDNIYFGNYAFFVIRKITSCLTAVINAQPTNVSLCNSGNAVFSVNVTNANNLKWQVNAGAGWNNLNDDLVYSGSATSSLAITGATSTMNSYQYRCVAANICGDIFSVPASLTVATAAAPTISISPSVTTACSTAPITFTATLTNGGVSPVYQWKRNGINTGTNSNTYIDNALSNGDVISCTLTSNSTCAITNIATSNPITVNINPVLTASISITAPVNTICAGSPLNFNATVLNGGVNPAYQWKKNGIPVGLNSAAYVDNSLNHGDVISCVLTSDYSCPVAPIVTSNAVMISVSTTQLPAVVIRTPALNVCQGSSATFTANASNAGTLPIYQWKKNDLPTGINSNSYTETNISQGDIISCTITSNSTCATVPTATSNVINMSLFQPPLVKLDQNNSLCKDGSRLLDAGNFAGYSWNNGYTGRTLLIIDTGTYYVNVIDNNNCRAGDTVRVATWLNKPVSFLPKDSSVCSYGELTIIPKSGYKNYLWNNNSISETLIVKQAGIYTLEVQDNNNCKGKDTIVIAEKQCMTGFYIPNGFTPNSDGKNDLFKPMIFGNVKFYEFMIYNRWGQIVFRSNSLNEGWDGTYNGPKQNTEAFVWTCRFQLDGEKQEFKKGTVALIR